MLAFSTTNVMLVGMKENSTEYVLGQETASCWVMTGEAAMPSKVRAKMRYHFERASCLAVSPEERDYSRGFWHFLYDLERA